MIKKFAKIAALLFGLCLLIGVVLLTILYLNGDLHRRIQSAIIQIVEEKISARIEVGSVNGSLLRTVQLEKVRLYSGADTLFSAASLRCRWRPLSLLWGWITISELELTEPRIALQQFEDGSWNYESYFRPATDTSRSNWSISLKSVRLHNGHFTLQLPENAGLVSPLFIGIPQLAANGRITPGGWRFEVEDANPRLRPGGWSFTHFLMAARGEGDSLNVSDLRLETAASRLRASMTARLKPDLRFTAAVRLDSLDAGELKPFTTRELPFTKVHFALLASGTTDSIVVEASAGAPAGRLLLRSWIKPAGAAAGTLEILALDTNRLSGLPGHLSARLDFSGLGFSLEESEWTAQGVFHHPLLDSAALREAVFNARLSKKRVTIGLNAAGQNGSFIATAGMELIPDPIYDLEISLADLDLAPLTGRPSLISQLNLQLRLLGRGMSASSANGQAWLYGHPSRIAGMTVDTLYACGHYRFSGITLDTLELQAPGLKASGSGSWRNRGPFALSFFSELKEHRAFAPWLGADSLRINGKARGTLLGSADSLQLQATAQLAESAFEAITAKKISASLVATRAESLSTTWRLTSGPIMAGKNKVADGLDIRGASAGSHLSAEGALSLSDSLTSRFSLSSNRQDSLWEIILPQLEVRHRQQIWRLENEAPRLTLAPNRISVSGLILVADKQRLMLAGHIDLTDSLSLELALENMNLGQWAGLFPGFPRLDGAMTWRATLSGTASNPKIVTTVQAEKLALAGLPMANLQFNGSLQDNLLIWKGTLTQSPDNTLRFNGQVPLRLSWPLPPALILAADSIHIAISTTDLQIGLLSAFAPELTFKGGLSGDLILENTWRNPQPGGYLQLKNGSFLAPYLGKPYKQIQARLELQPSRLLLSGLTASGGEGHLRGEGFWQFELNETGLHFKEMHLLLKSDHFTAADGPEMTLVLDGTVELSDQLSHPKLNGTLRVERARIDLPAFTETPSTLMQADQPLLLVSRGDTTSQSYDRRILLPGWMPFVERLRGSVKVEIPRNTWLRSPEMNIEIAGDLDLAKEGKNFGLFGTIRIVRGNYDLFSRRFDIQEGTLTFTGGDNLPQMQLQADHIFRSSDKIRHELSLTASGELNKPVLNFKLDDTEIAEADAVSYLAFGRSFGELTRSEKSALAQNQLQMSSDAVKQLLAGQLASQLTRSIQQTLDLDVIEFRGDQNWRQATVVVGKYLTNDLYMSYERQLNLGRTNEVVPEQVTLEYEIIRSLFLQASRGDEKNTGFDLIWKFEK